MKRMGQRALERGQNADIAQQGSDLFSLFNSPSLGGSATEVDSLQDMSFHFLSAKIIQFSIQIKTFLYLVP